MTDPSLNLPMPAKPAVNEAASCRPEATETPTREQRHLVNTARANDLNSKVLTAQKAQRMAEFFSLLGDPNRLRLLSVLAEQELCVCDIASVLGMSESAVSHQLRMLRAMRLVSYRKQGRQVFYRLQDSHVITLYRAVAEHLDEAD